MTGVRGKHVGQGVWWKRLKEGDHSEDLVVDVRIILQGILKK